MPDLPYPPAGIGPAEPIHCVRELMPPCNQAFTSGYLKPLPPTPRPWSNELETPVTGSSLNATNVVDRCVNSTGHRIRRSLAAVACATALVAAAGCGGSDDGAKSPAPAPTTSTTKASKPQKIETATTFKTVHGLPRDTSFEETDGAVVHPKKKQYVYDKPSGTKVAKLPVKELGNPTWVPVVERKSGWLRILLPARPNGATGWIKSSSQLQHARTKSVIKVDVAKRKLTLLQDGEQVGSWTVAVGTSKTPTPKVRTYLMASIIDAKQAKYTPIVFPLGAHSDTLDTFGGGPGTVAIHGWTTDSKVFGNAVTNGCIRIPADGLDKLRSVPLGSLVLIQ